MGDRNLYVNAAAAAQKDQESTVVSVDGGMAGDLPANGCASTHHCMVPTQLTDVAASAHSR